MTLFQNSVLNKYIKDINQEALDEAWNGFTKHFHDPKVQENIRSHNEEQYQAKFLLDLFVNILGYTLNPDPNYNLITEQKNEKGSKKADGAILQDDKVIAVIELKGTNTTDLNKIEAQAFGYKSNQANCNYVVTSNFEKLRFYIDNAIEFEEFNLFTLSKERFSVLWLCLAKENVFKAIPKKIKEQSLTQEEAITKQLYKDYAQFRNVLFENIVNSNPDFDKLTLFNKTQKLLDRLLFIFFAEDRLLLPPNSIREIVSQWTELKENYDEHFPLYDRFKKYFNYMNTGYKGKQHEIFAYNGGLFAPDEVLDNIKIDDKLLHEHSVRLSDYDFMSEVSVNILGHIFEHSLNDIEQIQNELAGVEIDKSKTKRKKDGVFYTPKYITKYIVDNTLGKLCIEKKNEFEIIEEEYNKDPKGRKKNTIKRLNDKLDKYREWLLQVTICDPACGSGAFLNQALEFLIAEHAYIDELVHNLFGDSIPFPNVENAILENNLYGVDINEESIEIAKLSLWLRTAQKGRKLTSLNNNIKCGNSLINDKAIAGDKAFNWESEFKEVLAQGGFDIVIGNPPYGAKLNKPTQKFLNERYINGGSETVISFIALSKEIIRPNGELGFIIPKSFSFSSNYKSIREDIISGITAIVDCGKVWKEVKLEQLILLFQKGGRAKFYNSSFLDLESKQIKSLGDIEKNTFEEFDFILNGISPKELDIAYKIREGSLYFNELANNSRGGGFQREVRQTVSEIKVLAGANIQRFGLAGIKGYAKSKEVLEDRKNLIGSNSVLVQNIVSHINNPVPHIKIIASLPESISEYVILDTINQLSIENTNVGIDNIILWLYLNSSILNWYAYRFIFGKAIRTMHFDNVVTSRLPIPTLSQEDIKNLKSIGVSLSGNYKEQQKLIHSFTKYVLSSLSATNEDFSSFENWGKSTFKSFIGKLSAYLKNEKQIKMTKQLELEWFELFEKQKSLLNIINNRIEELTLKANNIFFKAFDLSKVEIDIIKSEMP